MGTTLKVKFQDNFTSSLYNIRDAFPKILFGVLSQIGYMGRKQMEFNLLNGQYIKLRVKPKGKDGRRTMTYGVLPGMKGVRIASYPLNLHDPRKAYRKLQPFVESQLDRVVDRYHNNQFKKFIKELDK